MTITGGCLCRAVRYTAAAPPFMSRLCYCRVCQYFACGNAAVQVAFHAGQVTFTGEIREFFCTADSGNQMARGFCPVCGVQITTRAESRPETIMLRSGTLDDPNIANPTAAIWTASAPRWACIDPALENFSGQPPPPIRRG